MQIALLDCCELGDFHMGVSKGLTPFLRWPKVVLFLDPQFIWFCFSTPQVVSSSAKKFCFYILLLEEILLTDFMFYTGLWEPINSR